MPRFATRWVSVLAVPLLLAGVVTGCRSAAPVAASPTVAAPGPVAAAFTASGYLFAVAAVSGSKAWAVGYTSTSARTSKTMIVGWNGTAWAPEPSPGPMDGELTAVAADLQKLLRAERWLPGWSCPPRACRRSHEWRPPGPLAQRWPPSR